MPNVNIPASVRFGLYLLSAFGSVFVAYAFAKGFIGDAETACWAGLVAVVNGIAAANTNLSGGVPVVVHERVGEVADEAAADELERGQYDAVSALVVVLLVLLCLVLLGVIR